MSFSGMSIRLPIEVRADVVVNSNLAPGDSLHELQFLFGRSFEGGRSNQGFFVAVSRSCLG
jgi:hypothetical protein